MDDSLIVRGGIALSAKGADTLVAAAKVAADAMDIAMCIAVVDAGGSLMAFGRTDGAPLASIQLAITKAVSAATRRRATSEEMKIRPEDPTHTIRMTLAAGSYKVTALSGGIPVFVEGQLAGGIGVSGGSGHEDISVVRSAIQALGTTAG